MQYDTLQEMFIYLFSPINEECPDISVWAIIMKKFICVMKNITYIQAVLLRAEYIITTNYE